MSIDSGATTHAFTKENTGINNDMVHINLPFSNITKTPNGVKVMYPDGNTAQATHEAVLNLPILPIAARKVHLFESLASGALISLGKLCDSGCTAYFNATKVYIFFKGKIIMQGARSNATNNLWKVNGTKVEQPTMSLNAVIDKPTIAERIKFYHASLFSPTLDTLAKAVSAGYLTTFPTFTVKQLRKFPPRSEATVKGHMRAQRKGLKQVVIPSPRVNNTTLTQPPIAYVSDDEEEDDEDEDEIESEVTRQELPTQETTTSAQPTSPTLRTNHVYAACLPISGQVYTDQSGKIFVTSASGMNYIFLLYDYDSNLVWAIAIPSRSKLQLLKAYKTAFALLQSRGLKPQLQRIDNECSKILKAYMAEQQVEYQLTPRGKHARNAAEKGIQIWKDHFLAGMATTNPKFPLSRWDKLVEQSNITLNLLRPSRVNPQLSAYAQVFGAFDYSKTPIPPPGMRVLAHVLPKDRASFASHSIPGYSIGPAMEHYRCFKIFVPSTGGTRIADTVRWFPHGDLKMPIASKESLLHAAIQDLSATIKSTVKNRIRYTDKKDAQHLIDHLNKQYTCTVDWDGAIFLGMHLEWDYINRTVTITMPGYVKKAIIRFEHIASFLHQYSPHPYTAPKYGAKVQYADIIAADPNLTPEQKKFVQQVVGVFLFYGRTCSQPSDLSHAHFPPLPGPISNNVFNTSSTMPIPTPTQLSSTKPVTCTSGFTQMPPTSQNPKLVHAPVDSIISVTNQLSQSHPTPQHPCTITQSWCYAKLSTQS